MSELTVIPWEAAWAITAAVLGLGIKYLRDKQREDMRKVIQEECRPPDFTKGRPPGAIYSSINGNVNEKLDAHYKRITQTVRETVREAMRDAP